MKTVAFHTLGCKLNYAETSTIGRQFTDHGFRVVPFEGSSDVYLLNTCSVTERADRECRQIVRRIRRRSPEAYIIVTGCYAQLRPDDLAQVEGIDLILGTKEKFGVFERAGGFHKSAVPQTFVSCIDGEDDCAPAFSAEVGGRTRAFLKVQDGCDYSCAFCTIPAARGASRSVPADLVLQQARTLAGQGFKELVLTGVNVGDYGRRSGSDLLSLLRLLEGVDGIERIRVSSIEPNLLNRSLIDHILSSDKCCRHFHIPLQSGSDEVLKGMRRRYLRRLYEEVVRTITAGDPDAGIGADVITGFPGETDVHFRETAAFLADLPLSYLHVFTYSERPGTPAESMDGAVDPRIRHERSALLRDLGRRKRSSFAARFVGKTLPVLLEHRGGHGRIIGLTSNYLRVGIRPEGVEPNQIVPVTVETAGEEECLGILARPGKSSTEGELHRPHVTMYQSNYQKRLYQESL